MKLFLWALWVTIVLYLIHSWFRFSGATEEFDRRIAERHPRPLADAPQELLEAWAFGPESEDPYVNRSKRLAQEELERREQA